MIKDPDSADRVLAVEHPSVYTLGKRGGSENLVVSHQFLESRNIDIVKTDRGGNITYHGPGQLVLYPIINIEKHKIGVKDFVFGLEEVMIRTARDFDVLVNRDPKNHGVWAGPCKIGSVGIAVKKGITFHGLALNVTLDLTPFSWINPCGLTNVAMTSILQEQEKDMERSEHPSIPAAKENTCSHFKDIFNFQLVDENENQI